MNKRFFIFLMTINFLSFSNACFAGPTAVGVKNFRSLNYSLAAVTGVKPTPEINKYFKSIMTRLPKDGRLDEVLNPSTLMTIKSLAALFCKEFSKNNRDLSQKSDQEILAVLSDRIYGRNLSDAELKTQLSLISSAQDKVFVACTSQASSMEFLLQ